MATEKHDELKATAERLTKEQLTLTELDKVVGGSNLHITAPSESEYLLVRSIIAGRSGNG